MSGVSGFRVSCLSKKFGYFSEQTFFFFSNRIWSHLSSPTTWQSRHLSVNEAPPPLILPLDGLSHALLIGSLGKRQPINCVLQGQRLKATVLLFSSQHLLTFLALFAIHHLVTAALDATYTQESGQFSFFWDIKSGNVQHFQSSLLWKTQGLLNPRPCVLAIA